MAGEGAARSYPQRVSTDLVRDGWKNINDLGDAIAVDLGQDAPDNSNGKVTAASGFTVYGSQFWNVGRLAIFTVILTRSGASLPAAPSNGNISDVLACTVSGAALPDALPGSRIPFAWQGTAYSGGGYMAPDGTCTLTDMNPTAQITNGDTVRLHLVYRLAA